ncbi:MAG TPA: Clp protease N-terminal domain-containing protein [Solirubrobacteraceae bacterium]|nr:Clp protease N-terminal domain-containing protein [Solirubrobacteraceae bacterium]
MTDRAREALVNAQAAAQKCRHRSIDAPHLLLGVLRRPDTKGGEALNQAGLEYWDVLIPVIGMYEQAPEETGVQPSFTPQANELLEGWVGEALGRGDAFIETAHLALACSRPGRCSSLEPFVAGREQAIRDAALGALRRPAPLPGDESARRSAPRDPRARMDALERANKIRIQRAHLKRELRSGQMSIRQVLLHPPDYVMTARVAEVLLAMTKWGRARVLELLVQCRISPSKTIGGLSQRQRAQLIMLLST